MYTEKKPTSKSNLIIKKKKPFIFADSAAERRSLVVILNVFVLANVYICLSQYACMPVFVCICAFVALGLQPFNPLSGNAPL